MTMIYDTVESNPCLWSTEFIGQGHVEPHIITLPVTVPDAVVAVATVQKRYTSVQLSIDIPADNGGSDILGYV